MELTRSAPAAKYAFPVAFMCRQLRVSASGYYEWRTRPESATAGRRKELTAQITDIFEVSDATYGYRRVRARLERNGVQASLELVRFLMREAGLVPCQPKAKRRNLTDGTPGEVPDLIGRDFTAPVPGVKFVGDVTYIWTDEGWSYLATVLDCCTKEVVGYALGEDFRTGLIIEAMAMARRDWRFGSGAIFHSDRGSNGGFNWSLQHLDRGGVDGQTSGMVEGTDGPVADEVAGGAVASPRRGATVLAGDRQGRVQRGCRGHGRRVPSGRSAMVQGTWRHADVHAAHAPGPLPVF
ncbi:IS3 family transposase [Glycomyces sp. NRRL B-16210]|uniref:IS3 family transposase n=1 Tax=Glycomyces sp. NRRL B-16210 TaxID=1463821 RepID=UPI00210126DD|nr:IS3 family transposase [Glycomyces sp. NRRL B-16210]